LYNTTVVLPNQIESENEKTKNTIFQKIIAGVRAPDGPATQGGELLSGGYAGTMPHHFGN